MKFFLQQIIIALFFSLSAEGQSLDVVVIDPNDDPIEGVLAIDFLGREYGPSSNRGIIRLPAEAGTQVQFFKEGYYIKVIAIDWSIAESQPVLTVRLKPNDISLNEVVVSAEKIPFTDTLRVLDFDFQDSGLFVLGYDYLILASLDFTVKWQTSNRSKFKSVERDPRGNLFLLSKDSASQILLRENYVYFYPAVSISQYNTYIKPLKAIIGENLILRNIVPEQMPLPISHYRAGNKGKSMSFAPYHNQGAEFFIYREGKDPERFYFSVDTAGVLVAHDAFLDAYNIAAAIERYYDRFGIWQHEKLFDLDQAQKIYRMAYAKDIPIPIFKREGQHLLFDRFRDIIMVFDENGSRQDSISFKIDDSFHPPLIVQNYWSEQLYVLKEKRGMISLAPLLNFEIGSFQKLALFARETKVYDQWILFIDESNYLRRQKLNTP